MRTTTLLIVMTLCLVARAEAQSGDRSFGDGTLPEHLAVYDVDGDGILSVEEIQAMKDARLTRHDDWQEQWDTNGDGVIDEDERAAAKEAIRDRIEERRTRRFNQADTDGDGCLTFAEFSAIPAVMELAKRHPEAPARIFDRLDVNDDDCISLEEFVVHLRHRRDRNWRNPLTYARADKDNDGCLTFAEFRAIPEMVRLAEEHPGKPAQFYARLDADDDQCLTLAEFTAELGPDGPPPPDGPGGE